jgi:DNA anti-recombination protein RmuC
MWQSRAGSSDTEQIIEVIDSVPAAPQTKRTEVNAHLRHRIVATKVRALATKAERPAAAATTHSSQDKGTNTSVQIKILTDLVKSLAKAMEDQKQIHQNQIEALIKMHENQIETITKTVTQQIDTLKGEMAMMAEQIQTQLSSIQTPSPSPSYAEVARTPPKSWPSSVVNSLISI